MLDRHKAYVLSVDCLACSGCCFKVIVHVIIIIISSSNTPSHKWTKNDIYLRKSNEIRGETTNVTEMEAI